MKNRYLIFIFTAVLGLVSYSCNDFLDTLPDNRTELDNEDKITKLLVSAYPLVTPAEVAQLMSDDHDDVGTGYTSQRWQLYHTQAWNWDEITDEDTGAPNSTWEEHYKAISSANHALLAIEEMGNPESLSAQRGEALICRAYSHFVLVNVFCQNYSEQHSGTDLGVPYIEIPETEVNPVYSRGTVKEVYEKIERDILEGLPLIDDNIYAVPKYHFNRRAANAFAAEFYLFYKKWDKVIEYSTAALGSDPASMLRDVSKWQDATALPPNGDARFYDYIKVNSNANFLIIPYYSFLGGMMNNDTWGKRYLHNGLIMRTETLLSPSVLWSTSPASTTFWRQVWSTSTQPIWYTRLTIGTLWDWDEIGVSGEVHTPLVVYTAENSLLTRAEAYIQKEDYASAMIDINMWLKNHVARPAHTPKTEQQVVDFYGPDGIAYYTSTAPTPKKKMYPEDAFKNDKHEAFIHAILHLRRIEFWGEGKRWFDIKRYNIEITRRQYREESSGYTIEDMGEKLAPRDKRMAVQLPTGVISAGLTANPR